jgi:Uma2 family endonuclease
MTTAARVRLLTAEESYRLADPDDGGKMELVRGEVVRYMPVGRSHGKIASRLDRALGAFVDDHALGETHVQVGHRVDVDPDTVRSPDVWFMSNEQIAEGFIERVPALESKVKLPSDSEPKLIRKAGEYLVAGARRVWIVRPEEHTVSAYRDDGNVRLLCEADTLTSDNAGFAAEGFELPLARLFA